MAIVPNKDGMGIIANGFSGIVDRSFCVPTAASAGVPSTAAAYVGERRVNTTTGALFQAYGLGVNDWMQVVS